MKRTVVSMAALVIGLGGGMGGLHGIAHAQGGTPVTCGSVIAAPGEYYLASDCAGAGITISSNDVHLKLDGHTMTGSNINEGILVWDTANDITNVSIEGPGTIQNYFRAVDFEGVTDSHVWKVTGMRTGGATFFISGSGNLFNNDTAVDSRVFGFRLVDGTDNHLVNDVADGSHDDGIYADPGTSGNVIESSEASNNGLSGILLDTGATDNAIHGNTAYGNGVDLEDDNPNCDSNNWEGNHFATTNQPQCVS